MDFEKPYWNQLIKKSNPGSGKRLESPKLNASTFDESFRILNQEKGVENGPLYLKKALQKIKPFIKLGKAKRSGRSLHVPNPIHPNRALRIRKAWLWNRIKKKKNKAKALSQELLEIQRNTGTAYKQAKEYKLKLRQSRKNLKYRW